MKRMLKTYWSVYPFPYRLIVVCLVPLFVMGVEWITGIGSARRGADVSPYVFVWICGLVAMAEVYGEFFSLGALYAKREAFGEIVLSSPRGRAFIRDFARADVLRRLISYPLMLAVPQALLLALGIPGAMPLKCLGAGIVLFAAVQFGIWLYRKTKSAILLVIVVGAVMALAAILLVLYFAGEPPLALTALAVCLIAAPLLCLLSIRSLTKSTEDDYYDKAND